MWTYLLIEDEPPARDLMHGLIARARPDARPLGEAEDGVSGLALIRAHRADCLFLDIEFPPEGAFGLLSRAREEGLVLPPIVFVTAYDHYAVEAFRWAACDYLMKPVEPGHLAEAIARVAALRPLLDVQQVLASLQSLKEHRVPERFTVQVKGRLRLLEWKDVTHLRTENRLLFVHTPEGRFILDRSLEELEPMLAPAFLRVHRSAMVAVSAISELEAEPGLPGEAILRDGTRLPVSRERLPAVRKRLVGG